MLSYENFREVQCRQCSFGQRVSGVAGGTVRNGVFEMMFVIVVVVV